MNQRSLGFAVILIAACYTVTCGQDPLLSGFEPPPKQNSPQRAPLLIAQNTARDAATQKNQAGKKVEQKTPDSRKAKPVAITPDREAEILEFVRTHHKPSEKLLLSLKKVRKGQYQSTIKTFDREIRTFASQKNRAPERYKNSLETWKIRSQIRLLTAHLTLKKTEAEFEGVLNQIKPLLVKHQNLEEKRKAAELKALKDRMSKLQTDIKKAETALKKQQDSKKKIDQQLDSIRKTAERIRDRNKKSTQKSPKKNTTPAKGNADSEKKAQQNTPPPNSGDKSKK